ncbi:hypothetical protein [Streptomyces sp. S1D4-20]|uniref:hypothetical protein n=1 Tax=Streptomyces sp. S1D4-20 TaxID=2594462 RepID=UPI0011623050|nr:hypothetical protein [Streptomyces sp. S1D4-20]QDN57338.1 hypothetical protein FNV67_20140 [Streptomyces sp. S1D4-20]
MHTHTPAEWAAFLSLGLSLASATAVPFVLLIDADHFAWPRPLTAAVERVQVAAWSGSLDPLLREWGNARHVVRQTGRASREACRDAAALIVLLTTSPKGAMTA